MTVVIDVSVVGGVRSPVDLLIHAPRWGATLALADNPYKAQLAARANKRYLLIMQKRSQNVTKSTPEKRGKGNPRDYPERVLLRLPAGTKVDIGAVIEDGEDRASFIRAAIEREIKRRQRSR